MRKELEERIQNSESRIQNLAARIQNPQRVGQAARLPLSAMEGHASACPVISRTSGSLSLQLRNLASIFNKICVYLRQSVVEERIQNSESRIQNTVCFPVGTVRRNRQQSFIQNLGVLCVLAVKERIQNPEFRILNNLRLPTFAFHLLTFLLFLCGSLSAKPLPAEYDFGTVDIGTSLKHTFQWKNSSAKPVKVVDVAFSCTCMKLLSKTDTVPAGGMLDLEVGWVAEKSGILKFEVLVAIEGQAKPLLFKIQGKGEDAKAKPVTAAYLEGSELQKMLAEKKPLQMIDVRTADEYAQIHIPGSIPMPLDRIKTRDDMRSQTIILITNIETPSLWREYQALSAQGFQSIRVLKGGLQAWVRSGASVNGMNASSPEALRQIDAMTAYDVLRYGRYALVDMGAKKSSFQSKAIKPVSVADLSKIPLGTLDGVILVGQPAAATVAKLAAKLPAMNLYLVNGGSAGLQEVAALREATVKPTVMTINSSGMTLVSGSSSSPGSGGGCGGCPK